MNLSFKMQILLSKYLPFPPFWICLIGGLLFVNNILEYQHIEFNYVITVCDNAKERCPYFPGNAIKLHHNFPDPTKVSGTDDEIKNEFKRVREMIKIYCMNFFQEHIQ
jgi:arsenate reductase